MPLTRLHIWLMLGFIGSPLAIGCQRMSEPFVPIKTPSLPTVQQPCQPRKTGSGPRSRQEFLVVGGGGAPSYNEIAIEKNVLYFQRTLSALGFNPTGAKILFANGNDGQATVRYLDPAGKERFKVPKIPNLQGAATVGNFQTSMQQVNRDRNPLFFYFTGHGAHNKANENNNAMILWNEKFVDVQQFTQMLDRLPPEKPVVSVMVQCYSGSFANLIYQKGDPKRPVAVHDRCGFFATVKELPSVGCTPEVNEADYEDYSSSFFAGLSGTNRVGQKVASADYDSNGKVSFREAHAFAKIDEQASDLPVSTSEVWLQTQLSDREIKQTIDRPIQAGLAGARPEQKAVIAYLVKSLNYDLRRSHRQNRSQKPAQEEVKATYESRLAMELLNLAAEQKVRQSKNAKQIAILNKLLTCEGRSL